MRAIDANRELLLAPAICDELRASWSAQHPGAFARWSRTEFAELLHLLVRRRTRLDRAATPVDAPERSGAWRVRDRFEAISRAEDATALGLLAGRYWYERLTHSRDDPSSTLSTPPRALDDMDGAAFYGLGAIVPPATLALAPELDATAFRVRINDVRLPWEYGLSDDERLVAETPDSLAAQGIVGEAAPHPSTGQLCTIVQKDASVAGQRAGHPVWDPAEFMALCLDAALVANAGHLISTASVECALDLLAEHSPDLVRAVRAQVGIVNLTSIQRELLYEEVSVLDLRGLLESILSIEGSGLDPDVRSASAQIEYVADRVRADFKRNLYHRCLRDGRMRIHALEPALEQRLAAIGKAPLDELELRRLHSSFLAALASMATRGDASVVVTQGEIRRPLQHLLDLEMPTLVVLAYSELSPDANLDLAGRIGWPGDGNST